MLRDLHLRNLAVISEAGLEFGPGLNVLTGETGAGKSILVDSLALLAGARARSDLIRSRADLLTVTGAFDPRGEDWREPLRQAGLELDGEELVVRREVSREGRNRVFVNDQPITLRLLSEIAPRLMRIHAQREELELALPEIQRSWLDRSGGPKAPRLLSRVSNAHRRYAEIAGRLDRLSDQREIRLERIDLMRFQAAEIDAARLERDEEEGLRAERKVLRHAEAIAEGLARAYAFLSEADGAAVDSLSRALRCLREIEEWEAGAREWSRELDELGIRAGEVAEEVRRRAEGVEADPGRLNEVEERLALIERLGRKYGGSTAKILEHREMIARELEELEGDSDLRGELEQEVAVALEAYREAAQELSRQRRVWGGELAERVMAELKDLALRRARFDVVLERRRRVGSPLEVEGEPVEFSDAGWDRVTFRLAANPGEEPGPLSRVASGGELSRIYLALQLAVRGAGEAARAVMVFDEVDAGIGGAEAAAVGRKLKRLSAGGQVLVVTHLAQIASFADRHFKVEKKVAKGRAHTAVELLSPEAGRVEEVARMLAGRKVTDLSLSHARELIESSQRGPS